MKIKYVLCLVLPFILAACLFSACAGLSSSFTGSSQKKVLSDFTYKINGSGSTQNVTITGYVGAGGAAEIPDMIENIPVVAIGKDAFDKCIKLTSLTIPASVIIIAEQIEKAEDAFDGATGLTSITVNEANTVFSSEDGVLFNKAKTTLFLCPEGKIGNYIIPSSVSEIVKCAFENCVKLTNVTIPDSVKTIGQAAFISCKAINSTSIPDSVTYIGGAVFQLCSNLTTVTISPINDRKWDIETGNRRGSEYEVIWVFSGCPLNDTSKTALKNAGYPTKEGKF